MVKINLRSILAGILLGVILAGVVFFVKRNRPVPPAPAPIELTGTGYQALLKALGPSDAPVKIVEYSDFECPSCRFAQQELHRILEAYPEKIQVIYKHFPLSSHRWSIYAHQAAECMNAQGKFWPYQERVYDRQSEWAPLNIPPVEVLARYARELGADMDRFGKCMSDVDVTRAIYAEKEEGNQRQVNATPTFFINEERFVGSKELQERGQNMVRKILGLPAKLVPEEAPEPLVPAPLKEALPR